MVHFKDRKEAGILLADKLKDIKEAIVLPLPRGGVVLGVEIAKILGSELDLMIVRKIGHPYQPEYAIGAINEIGEMIGNEEALIQVDKMWLQRIIESERREAVNRRNKYLKGRQRISLQDKNVILVDDGIATGLSMALAARMARKMGAKKIIIAVPVAPEGAVRMLSQYADEIVTLEVAAEDAFLGAVGAYYDDFRQVEDEEVIELLKEEGGRQKDE